MINQLEIDKCMMTLKIIWAAIMMSLAVYLVVGRLVAPNMPSTMSNESFGMLRMALIALAIATLIAARFVKKLILSGGNRSAGPLQARPASANQKYTSAVIASLAMSESVGVYGLVLFLLGKEATDLYLLLGVSAAAMVYYRPRREELTGLDQGN
jgi:F0F1-type ATP synthase membrane subunit c/vacuolar-type H+-ATPase subunit K